MGIFHLGAGGGLTTLDNLQIIQWQANATKKDSLEFVVPWWELQIGVSVAQLIRLVASVDSGSRTATLQTMFADGTDEKLVQDFRLHPQGRTKMIAMAVQGVAPISSRKDDITNASKWTFQTNSRWFANSLICTSTRHSNGNTQT